MRQQADGDPMRDHARGQQQQQPNDGNARGNYAHIDQGNQVPDPRPTSSRDWNARIRASISRLMEIDGICLDPEAFAKGAEKRKVAASQQAFHTRVDRLQAASETAHREYYNRLRDVYSASTAKKMRLTTATNSPPPPASVRHHEALDALVVAAATEHFSEPDAPAQIKTKHKKQTKRVRRWQHPLPSQGNEGTERNPVAVHDPALTNAVEKLTTKMTELLRQLQATSDAASAESILAAAASIALEATEMRRCEEVALTRMVEIEEHRQQIMQGLLEYSQRKEKKENDDENKANATTSSVARPLQDDGNAQDTQADESQMQ